MADIIQWDKVMGKKVSSIDGEDLGKVENDKRISGLPVIDSDNNLNGIITRTDIVKALLKTKKQLVH